jgi:hypothetical protein
MQSQSCYCSSNRISEVEVCTAVCQVCPCPATNCGCILWRWMC